MMTDNSKWVACWGTATSITNRREATYAKDLTLRYPIRMCFSGTMLRFRFSNLTGTEPVALARVRAGHVPITFGGARLLLPIVRLTFYSNGWNTSFHGVEYFAKIGLDIKKACSRNDCKPFFFITVNSKL
jgi:hypothetical protein